MSRPRGISLAVWDFVVGDDWRAAVGVAVALGVTALVADLGVGAWWVMPIAVLGLLGFSVRRAAREAVSRGRSRSDPS